MLEGHKGVMQGQPEVELLRNTHGHQIWYKEPLTRVEYYPGVKGHIEVVWGQSEVKIT